MSNRTRTWRPAMKS